LDYVLVDVRDTMKEIDTSFVCANFDMLGVRFLVESRHQYPITIMAGFPVVANIYSKQHLNVVNVWVWC